MKEMNDKKISQAKFGAAYIRVSTHMQDELSPDAQKRLIMDHAKTDGVIISNDYVFVEKESLEKRRINGRNFYE